MEKRKRVTRKRDAKVISIQWDATYFFEKAVQSLDRYHYEKALKYFRRAVEYEPDNPVNHCNLAGVLSEMGNYDESNRILRRILEEVDPSMTECYFYMANNHANMENYESAEESLIQYLETDAEGQFLEESEEMLEFLCYELERPTKLKHIKCREGLFEHDRARQLLEEGKFNEAVRVLEGIVEEHPKFLAARNNLALAYYYMGYFERATKTIGDVLELEPGNLHALCNQAILLQHMGDRESMEPLVALLRKTKPFYQEHVFKLATTMGILGEHDCAYGLFKRLLKTGETGQDPCLYHYTAVAAYNIGHVQEAARLWKQAQKLDPGSDIPRFYLSQLESKDSGDSKIKLNYHYHLPFEEQFKLLETSSDHGFPENLKRDPLIRSSFFWALRHGDYDTKLQVIQALGIIADGEVEDALRSFVKEPGEDDYLKKVALFVLRGMGIKDPIPLSLEGKTVTLQASPVSPSLPVWEDKWQEVMETAIKRMRQRYDVIQQHDLQTLWVEYLTRVYPDAPKINKIEGWAAALEYLVAKMHRRTISYHEVASRYGIAITTVSKNVKLIDEACGLREKMNRIFSGYAARTTHK